MANFEEVGRVLDRKFEKLHQFLKDEVQPTTERRLAEALRKTSEQLDKLAKKLEERQAGKSSAAEQH